MRLLSCSEVVTLLASCSQFSDVILEPLHELDRIILVLLDQLLLLSLGVGFVSTRIRWLLLLFLHFFILFLGDKDGFDGQHVRQDDPHLLRDQY